MATKQISDEAVLKATGKSMQDWIEILDKFDVKKNGHTLAARFVTDRYKLSGWWAQSVVVKYEWARGLKKEPVLPADFKKELSKNNLLKVFNNLSPSHRREYIKSIEEAKRPETRQRRIISGIEKIAKLTK